MLPKQPNQSLIEGIRCLLEIVAQPHPVGVIDLAKSLDLEPSRVHRFLRTLSHLGFVRWDERRKYGPGPAVYGLALQSLYASHFLQTALPRLDELAAATGHIVAMGVLWQRSVSYLYHGTLTVRSIGSVGAWDATNSGIGMALLAQIDDREIRNLYRGRAIPSIYPNGVHDLLGAVRQIRSQGHAFVRIVSPDKHHTLGLALSSNPTIGIGISGRIKKAQLPGLLKMLQETARKIDLSEASASVGPALNGAHVV